MILLLNACYTYVPATPGAPGRASEVRAYLATPGSFEIGEILVQNVTVLDGLVIDWTDESLNLSATGLTTGAGQEFLGQGRTVSVPRERIAELEVKRISKLQTGLLAGAGVLFAALAAVAATGGSSSGDPPGGPDGTPR